MEDAAARRERLKALKAAAALAQQPEGDGPGPLEQQPEEVEPEKPTLKFRNYVVKDQRIEHEQVRTGAGAAEWRAARQALQWWHRPAGEHEGSRHAGTMFPPRCRHHLAALWRSNTRTACCCCIASQAHITVVPSLRSSNPPRSWPLRQCPRLRSP